jgi:hypothetical protein
MCQVSDCVAPPVRACGIDTEIQRKGVVTCGDTSTFRFPKHSRDPRPSSHTLPCSHLVAAAPQRGNAPSVDPGRQGCRGMVESCSTRQRREYICIGMHANDRLQSPPPAGLSFVSSRHASGFRACGGALARYAPPSNRGGRCPTGKMAGMFQRSPRRRPG